jgi:putative membrane protein
MISYISERGVLLFKEHLLETYSLWDLWNLDFLFIITLTGIVYWLIVGPLRFLFTETTDVRMGQKMMFLTGLAVLYFALGSPLHLLGHDFLFSAHMLEQSLVYMVAPPFLLLGIPGWLLRPLWETKLKTILKIVFNPLISILSFNALFSFYHIPFLFDIVNANEILHTVIHSVLMMAAIQMWWSITCPLPEQNRLSELKKMGYIVANGLLLYPACALIIFAGTPLYSTYNEVPQLSSFLDPLDDQQLGGVIMKLVQEGVFIFILGSIFSAWYRRENKDSMDDIDIINEKVFKT